MACVGIEMVDPFIRLAIREPMAWSGSTRRKSHPQDRAS
jgi:hypothetical protein